MAKAVLLFLFFISGNAALIYQMAWTRLCSILLGGSTEAVSLVLSTFLLGLGIGGSLGGNLLRKWQRPLHLYALIEIGIALSSLFVPFLLELQEPVFSYYYSLTRGSHTLLTLLRSLSCIISLIPPCILMGMSIPCLGSLALRYFQRVERSLALANSINTLGAMSGAFLFGFYFLPTIGLNHSLHFAASLSALGGSISFLLAKNDRWSHEKELANVRNVSGTPFEIPPSALFSLFFLLGFTSLGLEVLWSRFLGFAFLTGISTVTQAVVLCIYLGALALGGLIFSLRPGSESLQESRAGLLHMILSSIAVLALVFFVQCHLARFALPKNLWVLHFTLGLALMGAPLLFIGYLSAYSYALLIRSKNFSEALLGQAVAWNCLGSVLSPLLVGFLLLPCVGSQNTFVFLVLLHFFGGAAFLIFQERNAKGRKLLGGLLLLFASFSFFSPNILLRIFNPQNHKLLFFQEDSRGSYLAVETPKGVEVYAGGALGAGTFPRFHQNSELSAKLPLFTHPAPASVLAVCFGTGKTASFFAHLPETQSLTLVEIMNGAIEAGKTLFSDYNHRVLKSPKVQVIQDDGFNFLKYTPKTFDVISLDPYMPRNAGSARLYSRELLEIAKSHLNPGGVVTVWGFTRYTPSASFLLALKTFQDTFPNTTVWRTPDGANYFFRGSLEPLQFDEELLHRRVKEFEGLRETNDGISSAKIFQSLLILNESQARKVSELNNQPIFSLDLPNLEFMFLQDLSPGVEESGIFEGKI